MGIKTKTEWIAGVTYHSPGTLMEETLPARSFLVDLLIVTLMSDLY